MNLDLPAVVGASEELGDAGSGGEADHDHDSEAPIASNVGAESDQAQEEAEVNTASKAAAEGATPGLNASNDVSTTGTVTKLAAKFRLSNLKYLCRVGEMVSGVHHQCVNNAVHM